MTRNRGGTGKVRIIGGRWRGSILPVVAADGLRPSADRCRETLFNWLQDSLAGARCLDLFAGSGALGLEALSRGAASCTLVEQNPRVAAALEESIHRLAADNATLLTASALQQLEQAPALPYDIVFVDPPFGHGLATPVCQKLAQPGWLTAQGRVYLELAGNEADCWPGHWSLLREGRSRDVRYVLLGMESADDS